METVPLNPEVNFATLGATSFLRIDRIDRSNCVTEIAKNARKAGAIITIKSQRRGNGRELFVVRFPNALVVAVNTKTLGSILGGWWEELRARGSILG